MSGVFCRARLTVGAQADFLNGLERTGRLQLGNADASRNPVRCGAMAVKETIGWSQFRQGVLGDG